MKAFLTGSRVYGTPTEDSDIDLVIYCDTSTKEKLIELSDNGKMPCMFGKLNIIFAINETQYKAWSEAKEHCNLFKPISRELAFEIHDRVRDKYGVTYDHDSGEQE